jgi:hypothetical protein
VIIGFWKWCIFFGRYTLFDCKICTEFRSLADVFRYLLRSPLDKATLEKSTEELYTRMQFYDVWTKITAVTNVLFFYTTALGFSALAPTVHRFLSPSKYFRCRLCSSGLCDAVWTCRWVKIFRRNILSPSSNICKSVSSLKVTAVQEWILLLLFSWLYSPVSDLRLLLFFGSLIYFDMW